MPVSDTPPPPPSAALRRAFFEAKYGVPDGTEAARCAIQRAWTLAPVAARPVPAFTGIVLRTAGLSAAVGALGAAFGVVQALALGEHAEADPGAYAAWLATNMAQLMGAGLPQRLWRRLWEKLEAEACVAALSQRAGS
jgi:hypothetical protein